MNIISICWVLEKMSLKGLFVLINLGKMVNTSLRIQSLFVFDATLCTFGRQWQYHFHANLTIGSGDLQKSRYRPGRSRLTCRSLLRAS